MKHLTFFSLFLLLLSCSDEGSKDKFSEVNYYHWGQDFDFSESEQNILRSSKSKRIYVRFFDVQWDNWEYNAPVPKSVIAFQEVPNTVEVVPTVYITNEVMEKLAEESTNTRDLARRVVKKIQNIADTTEIAINEIQFDCDWNQTSKESYFEFLEYAKGFAGEEVELSATIRLHQVKYADKTGVPPVDKGALMVYNMGKLTDKEETNSIFNQKTTEQYLSGYKNYKLPLNLALPAFSWGVERYSYGGVNVINNLTKEDFIESNFFEEVSPNQFVATRSDRLLENYFSQGDTIRLEQPKLEELKWAIDIFNKEISNKPENPEIIFYEMESKFLRENYQDKTFKKP